MISWPWRADDALVAQRWDHAAKRHRPDDVEQDLVERQAHSLARFLQALVHRQQRTAHDLGNVGARVDDERDDGGPLRIHADVGQQRQGEVDEHHLHDDRRAADDRDIDLRDGRQDRMPVSPRHARQRAQQETAEQAPERDLDGHQRTLKQIG
ncbi:hypothetical protein G6F57_019842 [Rhizopus arrhizus]|nr:hypothetical protein G6F57_019842 [Rhizopus arrhizus]